MSDEEIIEMVLNPEQDKETDDEEEENDVTVISNERCIQLTKELIERMEQKPSIEKSHVMAAYTIQDIILKQKRDFGSLN